MVCLVVAGVSLCRRQRSQNNAKYGVSYYVVAVYVTDVPLVESTMEVSDCSIDGTCSTANIVIVVILV